MIVTLGARVELVDGSKRYHESPPLPPAALDRARSFVSRRVLVLAALRALPLRELAEGPEGPIVSLRIGPVFDCGDGEKYFPAASVSLCKGGLNADALVASRHAHAVIEQIDRDLKETASGRESHVILLFTQRLIPRYPATGEVQQDLAWGWSGTFTGRARAENACVAALGRKDCLAALVFDEAHARAIAADPPKSFNPDLAVQVRGALAALDAGGPS